MNISHTENIYSLKTIKEKLETGAFPFSGVTALGSAEFIFEKPAYYAGVVLHSASRIRPELIKLLEANELIRYREEDPYTERFIRHFPIQVIARDSRFEYDLNRAPHRFIYEKKLDDWGIDVWKTEPGPDEAKISLEKYREFHALMDIVTDFILKQNNFGIVFDMHSYCFRRNKIIDWFEDGDPDINIGTGPVNKKLFRPAIDQFINDLSTAIIDGHRIKVGENVKFRGGYLARRLSRQHYNRLLVVALEYKKIFMNENTGELYMKILDRLISGFSIAANQLIDSEFFRKL